MVNKVWNLIKRNRYSFQWIVWLIITIHFLWGMVLLIGPDYSGLSGIMWDIFLNSGSKEFWGISFITTSFLSLWSIFMKRPLVSLLLMLPQQTMLALPAVDIIIHWHSEFSSRDQLIVWMNLTLAWSLFVFHMLAILDQYIYTPWKEIKPWIMK